jgi:hypothetical protein
MKRLKQYIILLLCTCAAFYTVKAQVNLQNITLYGQVASGGKGIAGVAVTDGYNITRTDEKGEYTLLSNATAEYVYITLPAGYRIPVKNNAPCFYQKITDKSNTKQRFDFTLEKPARHDHRHLLVAWADPQVAFEEELPLLQQAAGDVKQLLDEYYNDVPAIGIVCGDIIAEIKQEPKFYEPVKRIISTANVPFFYAVGNHDMDVNVRSNHLSKETYKSHFGPTYYSFNRGKVHYVVLDDVFCVARSFLSIGYLSERQLNWLEQDLALVPQGATVVVALHIPTFSREARRREWDKETMAKVLQNRTALYDLLTPFNVHILSGHEHYNENYLIKPNLYEHLHTSLCGLFWQAPYSSDGAPRGYGVYEFDGDSLTWYFKTVGKDRNYQFNAYPVGTNPEKPDAITVNIWNYDPRWKVYWCEDEVRMGEMQSYTGYDPSITNYVKAHQREFKYKNIGAGTTDHLFYAVPESAKAKIKIEAIDGFGRVYRQDIN